MIEKDSGIKLSRHRSILRVLAVIEYTNDHAPKAGVFDDIERLWKDLDHLKRVVLDIPIGLCESLEKDEVRDEITNG